jgi:hypothetical protein
MTFWRSRVAVSSAMDTRLEQAPLHREFCGLSSPPAGAASFGLSLAAYAVARIGRHLGSPQIPDSPAAFLESCRGRSRTNERRFTPGGFFLAVYRAINLGCRPCFKRESERGDRYCEVVQRD